MNSDPNRTVYCFTLTSFSGAQMVNVLIVVVSAAQISGTTGPVGTSNIQESSLPFDLSFFKSLLQIEVTVPPLPLKYSPLICTLSIPALRNLMFDIGELET